MALMKEQQRQPSGESVSSLALILPLTTCVAKGDMKGVELHLSHDTDLEARNWVGATPLMLAIQYNRIKLAQVMILSINLLYLFLQSITYYIFIKSIWNRIL
jgi:ankyrin repeat protein